MKGQKEIEKKHLTLKTEFDSCFEKVEKRELAKGLLILCWILNKPSSLYKKYLDDE